MVPPYTIIIPAFNESQVIEKVISSLAKPQGCVEIILVNDGSTDDTGKIAAQMGVRVLNHAVNKGYGAALKTGILAATTSFIVLYDGDGQHRVEDLLKIIGKMPDYDMVVGARDNKSHKPTLRKPGKYLLRLIVNMLSKRQIPDFNSGLRAFNRSIILRYLHLMPEGFSFSTTSTVALNNMNYRVGYVPITVNAREGRKSSVRFFKDGFKTLLLIINLTVLFAPLRIFIPSAIFLMFASILYFILYSSFIRVHITASMTMLFLSGIIIFFMGILCEQISAIRRETDIYSKTTKENNVSFIE